MTDLPRLKSPRAPAGLGNAGKRLWRRLVVPELEYNPAELLLIEEAARTADVLAMLRSLTSAPGARVLREIRLTQEQLRRLVRSVVWPDDDEVAPTRSAAGRALALQRWRRGA